MRLVYEQDYDFDVGELTIRQFLKNAEQNIGHYLEQKRKKLNRAWRRYFDSLCEEK